MPKPAPKFTVGQTVYVYIRYRHSTSSDGDLSPATITKIGRKWAQMSDGNRFNVDKLSIDGGGYSSPGRVWLSIEEREAWLARGKAWDRLYRFTTYSGSRFAPDIPLEKIEQALEALGVPKELP